MDKAEEAALAAYPDYEKENSVGVLYKVSRKAERAAYSEGYNKSEAEWSALVYRLSEAILFDWPNKVDFARASMRALKERGY